MKSPSTSSRASEHPRAGMTLIEIMVVIGIVAMIGGFSLAFSMDNFRGDAFRAEESALATALQTARADALNNINQERHGVALHPDGYDGYVIFQGDSYVERKSVLDQRIDASYGIQFAPGTPPEIVFGQLDGNANYDGDIVLIDPQRNRTTAISINHEGRISW